MQKQKLTFNEIDVGTAVVLVEYDLKNSNFEMTSRKIATPEMQCWGTPILMRISNYNKAKLKIQLISYGSMAEAGDEKRDGEDVGKRLHSMDSTKNQHFFDYWPRLFSQSFPFLPFSFPTPPHPELCQAKKAKKKRSHMSQAT